MRICPACFSQIFDGRAACTCGCALTTFDPCKTYHVADSTEQLHAAIATVKRHGRAVEFIGTINIINLFGRPDTITVIGPVDYGGKS